MKPHHSMIVPLMLGWIAVGGAAAQEKTDKPTQPELPVPKCPVTGNQANLAVSAPTREGPVFFCKKECITQFKSDPSKFEVAVKSQRDALAQRPRVQVKCPVSGDPTDLKITLEKDGQKVAFCSEDCRKKYEADPSRYASALANAYTYQTKCPVMKELINPKSFITLESGEIVYFCCKGCDDKLLADPPKYEPVLREQGYTFDFSKQKKEGK